MFILEAISEHQNSEKYEQAEDGVSYASGHNTTIERFQKLLYNMKGNAVPDNYTANHKCKSGFFKLFVNQITAYLLKNGISFENESTKEKLGEDFDSDIYRATKWALEESVAFGFYNFDHIDFFHFREFIPLYDENDGMLKAGIRYWQIAKDKPMRATVYTIDGYQEFVKPKDSSEFDPEKDPSGNDVGIKPYKEIKKATKADGVISVEGENYPEFPIVPLYANDKHQSALVGLQEQIDCYDLIKSGFANDLDNASMIYWILKGYGGLSDDVSLAKFVEQMHKIGAVALNGDDEADVQAHTMDVPYQSREVYLNMLKKDLYEFAMALDVEQISSGNVTATQIQAAYEPLDESAHDLKVNITTFIKNILKIAGIEDHPKFNTFKISNQREETEKVLMAAAYLDDKTILQKLPFVTDEEIEEIITRKTEENSYRFPIKKTEVNEEEKEEVLE